MIKLLNGARCALPSCGNQLFLFKNSEGNEFFTCERCCTAAPLPGEVKDDATIVTFRSSTLGKDREGFLEQVRLFREEVK